jgi:hypothetical protein
MSSQLENAPSADSRRRGGVIVPLAAAGTALALVAAVTYGTRDPGDDSNVGGDPPVLRLSGAYAGAQGAPEPGPAHPRPAPVSGMYSGMADFRLAGTLPSAPTSARVHRPSGKSLDAADVARLASVLGIGGEPRVRDGLWTVGSGRAVLRLSLTTGAWTFVTGSDVCMPVPVDPDAGGADATVSCSAPAPGSARVEPVSGDRARRAARPVLDVLGLQAVGTVDAGPPAVVRASPQVAGLATVGMETEIAVDGDGVVWAHGWWGDAEPGATYPLLSAQKAFDAMSGEPRPEPALMCVDGPAGPKPGIKPSLGPGVAPEPQPETQPERRCPKPYEVVVTGASAGLLLALDGDQPLLVPAWLFAVSGQDAPVAQIAVTPDLLDTSGPTPGGSGSGGSAPGAPVAPADGGEVDPGAGGAEVAVSAAAVSGGGTVLRLTGGADGTGTACGATWRASAKETEDVVWVRMELVAPVEGASDCPAPQPQAVLKLTEPLGDRSVRDAGTDREVRVTR